MQLTILTSLAEAQTNVNVVNFKTPEVNAFNRNIETPVSMYSGVPSISIPLYEIKINGVTVPITLNYHAGGIRVDQEATWVGLGWSLDYGGTISRKVNGIPDEDAYLSGTGSSQTSIDYFNLLPYSYNNYQANLTNRIFDIQQAKNTVSPSLDYRPDEFYYSALGYSGKFMFSQEKNKFILFPKDDIYVQYSSDPNGSGPYSILYNWNLKLPDGTSVDFGKEGVTSQRTNVENVKSSWQIKTIRNTFGDSITYFYNTSSYVTHSISAVKGTYYAAYSGAPASVPSNQSPVHTLSTITNFDSQLSTITFPNGTVNFITTSRTDMPTGAVALSEIDIKDTKGNLIKKIIFNTSYFYGDLYDPNYTTDPTTVKYDRLRLNSVVISGADNNSQTYSFDYYTNPQMPSKQSYAQDHWGFYNGAANLTDVSFIPNIASGFFQGGDRSVHPAYSNVFSLKSVTYPTGGQAQFTYESNTAAAEMLPTELLNMYQDENILERTQQISFSVPYVGDPILASYANSTDQYGTLYFTKTFTVANWAYLDTNYGFLCSTNYGVSSAYQSYPYSQDNIEFDLYSITSSGNVLIKSFNTSPQNPNGANNTYIRTATDNEGFAIGPGNYEMIVALKGPSQPATGDNNTSANFNFTVKYRELDTTKMMINVGGLRIKNINYYDSNGTLANSKSYSYIDPFTHPSIPTFTSGRVVSLPNYFQRTYQTTFNTTAGPAAGILAINFFSNSNLPLETTSGSYAGYMYVDEYDVDPNNSNNNLRTNNSFSFFQPYFFSSTYPYMTLRAYEPSEWTYGKLLSKKVYKGTSILKQEDYTYYTWSPYATSQAQEDYVQEINTDLISTQYIGTVITGSPSAFDFYDGGPSISTIYDHAMVGGNLQIFGQAACLTLTYGAGNGPFAPSVVGNGSYTIFCANNTIEPYFLHYTGFDKPMTKVTTTYDGTTPAVETENYFYEKTPSLYQLTKTQIFNSIGDTYESRLQFPSDSATTFVYNHMVMRHMLNSHIVQAQYKNSTFLQSTSTNYKQWTDTSIIAPVRTQTTVGTAQPATRLTYLAYDTKGNPQSVALSAGPKNSYQWGYNQQYPVAETKNATVNDIFFDSFEEGDGNSSSGDAKTGHYSYTGTYTKALSGLDNGPYTLTYWLKSGSAWSLQTTSVTVTSGTYTIAVTGQIDDIRFYPAGALMSTYTYDPLVGMTSTADAKGEIAYYEYDGLQRLINIKNKDQNIVKSFNYHFGIPLQSAITVSNITGTAVSIQFLLPINSTSSCLLQYTDLTTNQVYQSTITYSSGSTTVSVPAEGRTYRFQTIENLTAGGQVGSGTVDVYVP